MFVRPQLTNNPIPIPYGVGKIWGMPMHPAVYSQYAYPGYYPRKSKKKKKSQRQQQIQRAKSGKRTKKKRKRYFMPPVGPISRPMNFLPPIRPPAFRFRPGGIMPLPPPIRPYGLSPRGGFVRPMPPWMYDYEEDDDSDDDYEDDDDYYDDDYILSRRFIPAVGRERMSRYHRRDYEKDFSPDWDPRDEWETSQLPNNMRKQPFSNRSERNYNQYDPSDNTYVNVQDATQKSVKTNGKKK